MEGSITSETIDALSKNKSVIERGLETLKKPEKQFKRLEKRPLSEQSE